MGARRSFLRSAKRCRSFQASVRLASGCFLPASGALRDSSWLEKIKAEPCMQTQFKRAPRAHKTHPEHPRPTARKSPDVGRPGNAKFCHTEGVVTNPDLHVRNHLFNWACKTPLSSVILLTPISSSTRLIALSNASMSAVVILPMVPIRKQDS